MTGVAATSSLRPISSLWWLLLLDAGAAAAVGIMLLVWPDRTLALAAGLVGAFLVVLGLLQAVNGSRLAGQQRTLTIALAVVAVAAGAFLLIRPEDSVRAVAIAAGAYLLLSGIVAGIRAAQSRVAPGLQALTAVVEIAVGIAIMVWPDQSVTVYATVMGIYLLARAVLKAAVAFAMRGEAGTA
jgi:uncharacterized membrane protein HdeD (DUF308 family)